MVVIKLRPDVFAYVDNGEWKAEDPVDLEMLESVAPYDSSPSIGDIDWYMANLAVSTLGATIERRDNPPESVKNRIY